MNYSTEKELTFFAHSSSKKKFEGFEDLSLFDEKSRMNFYLGELMSHYNPTISQIGINPANDQNPLFLNFLKRIQEKVSEGENSEEDSRKYQVGVYVTKSDAWKNWDISSLFDDFSKTRPISLVVIGIGQDPFVLFK